MTGHAAFARTLRALDADSFRVSKFALLTAVILLAVWTWWFFTPSIPDNTQHRPTPHSTTNTEVRRVSPATIVLRALHE